MNKKAIGYTLIIVSGSLIGVLISSIESKQLKPVMFLMPMIILVFGLGVSLITEGRKQ